MPSVISVDEIEDGMIVSAPVVNSYGQTLIPAGATISVNIVKLLKTWDIRSVSIKSDLMEGNVDISEEQKALAKEALSKRVLWKPRNPIEWDLLSMGVFHIATKLSKKPSE